MNLNRRVIILLPLGDCECETGETRLVALGRPLCLVHEGLENWLEQILESINCNNHKELWKLWTEVIRRECHFDMTQNWNQDDLRLNVAQMWKHIEAMMIQVNTDPRPVALKAVLHERIKKYETISLLDKKTNSYDGSRTIFHPTN